MRTYVTPILHPASILRGRWHLEPCQERYLRRLSSVLREGRPPTLVDWERPPTGAILRPSLSQLADWNVEMYSSEFNALAVDIENAGDYLLCVGLTPLVFETRAVGRTLVLPFRTRGGNQYWRSRSDLIGAVEFLGVWLADQDVTKVFHFGLLHDVPFLRRLGFDVEGRIVDTAALCHTAFTELPKGLQFSATLYCGAPVWKRLTDETDDSEGKT